jgi:molybdopterin/thiamine biosynthesis adenylyltransferase
MNSDPATVTLAPPKPARRRAGIPGFNAVELVLPWGMWQEIRDYLFSDLSREYACYLLCGSSVRKKTLRLLGCFVVLPQPDDYVSHSIASVRLKQSLLGEVLRECGRLGLSLIDLHSHPFAGSTVSFSGTDEADEREKADWFSKNLPNCVYGSIVLGRESHEARIRSVGGVMQTMALPIRPLDIPLNSRSVATTSTSKPISVDRHVRAFGRAGQERMSRAHIGIIGLGGIGSGLAIGLARLGVGTFTLVDPDRVEAHNINRVFGMSTGDADRRLRKTRLVSRELRRINESVNCRTYSRTVLHRSVWTGLLDCDLIVTSTDNHMSRMFLNTLSEQYLIPQISVGSLIETEDEKVRSACGHVRVLMPGKHRPCLLCSQIINPTEVYYERASDATRQEAARRGYISNFDEPAPAVVHLNGTLIHLALAEIHNIFCGFKELEPYLFYDLLDQEILHIKEEPTECAVCSPSGGYFGRGDLVDLGTVLDELLPS